MAKTEDALYKSWLEEVKGELKDDPDRLSAFDKLYGTDDDKTRKVFRGGLREGDYYRKLNELNATEKSIREKLEEEYRGKAQKWTTWESEVRTKHQTALDELEALKQKLAESQEGEGGERMTIPADVVRRQDLASLQEYVENIDSGATVYATDIVKVFARANREGIKLDENSIDKIYALAASERLTPMRAYESLTQEERIKKAEEALAARDKENFERGKKEALASQAMPDRFRGNVGTLSRTPNANLPSRDERRANALKVFLEEPAN